MFNIKFTNKLFSISLLTLVFSVSSFAQEIEEVVVTATKKEESTQDIAVSITAVTSDQLEADQIYDLSDLAEIIPGFETAKGIGSGSGFVMRGIGSYGVGAAVATLHAVRLITVLVILPLVVKCLNIFGVIKS